MKKYLIYSFDNGNIRKFMKQELFSEEECLILLKLKIASLPILKQEQFLICSYQGSGTLRIETFVNGTEI